MKFTGWSGQSAMVTREGTGMKFTGWSGQSAMVTREGTGMKFTGWSGQSAMVTREGMNSPGGLVKVQWLHIMVQGSIHLFRESGEQISSSQELEYEVQLAFCLEGCGEEQANGCDYTLKCSILQLRIMNQLCASSVCVCYYGLNYMYMYIQTCICIYIEYNYRFILHLRITNMIKKQVCCEYTLKCLPCNI